MFRHVMFDGPAFGMFMMAAVELAGNAVAPSVTPVRKRERFRSRMPPQITFDHHQYIQDEPPPKTSHPMQSTAALGWVT